MSDFFHDEKQDNNQKTCVGINDSINLKAYTEIHTELSKWREILTEIEYLNNPAIRDHIKKKDKNKYKENLAKLNQESMEYGDRLLNLVFNNRFHLFYDDVNNLISEFDHLLFLYRTCKIEKLVDAVIGLLEHVKVLHEFEKTKKQYLVNSSKVEVNLDKDRSVHLSDKDKLTNSVDKTKKFCQIKTFDDDKKSLKILNAKDLPAKYKVKFKHSRYKVSKKGLAKLDVVMVRVLRDLLQQFLEKASLKYYPAEILDEVIKDGIEDQKIEPGLIEAIKDDPANHFYESDNNKVSFEDRARMTWRLTLEGILGSFNDYVENAADSDPDRELYEQPEYIQRDLMLFVRYFRYINDISL